MANPPAQPTRQYPRWLAPARERCTAKGLVLAALTLAAAACTQSPPSTVSPDNAGSAATDPNAPAGGKAPAGIEPGTTPGGAPTAGTPPAGTAAGGTPPAGTAAGGTPPAGTAVGGTPTAGAPPDGTAPAGGGGDRRRHPEFVQKMIERFQSGPPENPPRKIIRATYQGQTVWYVSAPCCDFQSELYDSSGKKICSPDGGITGRGDGKCPDFSTAKKDELMVWQDGRAPAGKGGATGGTSVPPDRPPPRPKATATVTNSPPTVPPKPVATQ
ncbi:MAG TPA: hypothetical protein VFS43_19420 [Polyangiaceae bacterium]|nr:hypothetical protein [Polyangiaceae bacterium]